MKETVNPLLLQGAAMIVPPQFIFQIEATPDGTGVQVVQDPKTNAPVPTDFGRRFETNDIEITLVAMTTARLEEIPFGGALARLGEQALPYALLGGLLLAAGMYGRRVVGTLGQLRAATQTQVVEVPNESGPEPA